MSRRSSRIAAQSQPPKEKRDASPVSPVPKKKKKTTTTKKEVKRQKEKREMSAGEARLVARCGGDASKLRLVEDFMANIEVDEEGRVTSAWGLPVQATARVVEERYDALDLDSSLCIGERWVVPGMWDSPSDLEAFAAVSGGGTALQLGFLAVLVARGDADLENMLVNHWAKYGERLPWEGQTRSLFH